MGVSSSLHYEASGEGPPLLLLHGLFDSLNTWRSIRGPLSNRFKVYAVDLPCFGKTVLPEMWGNSLSSMMDAVIAFLDDQKIAQITLVGSSMGGSLALGLAGKYPDRVQRLVLLNPYALPVLPVAVVVTQMFWGRILPYLMGSGVLTWLTRIIYGRSIYDPDGLTDAMVEEAAQPFLTLQGRKNMVRFLSGIALDEMKAIDAAIPTLRPPSLIIWGQNDRWLAPAHLYRLQSLLRGVKIVRFSCCGHLPQIDYPDETAKAIISFLTGS